MRLARCAWIAGFDATSNVAVGRDYSIPVAGTMAHSYVQAFPDDAEAFRAFARSYPEHAILLVDTYDTPAGVRRAADLGIELARQGHRLTGVRLDSGDVLTLSREARSILDDAGLQAEIFASSNLDEHELDALLAADAPIDGFGVDSRLAVSADAPYLDMVYKLVELGGRPSRKLSSGKVTLPGRKQVWRLGDHDGRFAGDVLALADEEPPPAGEPLLAEVMVAGPARAGEPLHGIRGRALEQRSSLPLRHRALRSEPYRYGCRPASSSSRGSCRRSRRRPVRHSGRRRAGEQQAAPASAARSRGRTFARPRSASSRSLESAHAPMRQRALRRTLFPHERR
jgi:nicotinate phosphoribosyltransferase